MSGLSTVYFRHPVPGEPDTTLADSIPARRAREDTLPAGDEELDLSGAKTITAGFGTGGLGLDQSLRLNVRGSIAGVDLDAILSDQNTGLSPDGTTRELAELDKILIRFSHPNLKGSLGDFEFNQGLGGLGSITRQLRGAELAGQWQPGLDSHRLSGAGSYSKPKGRFGHNEFTGIDGRQGPYRLAGDLAGITVVAGSEAVYLDGNRLVRGWDNDYTLDYDAGELTFTNRHPMTSRSRIEVDFEYTTDEYDRTTLTARAGYDFGRATVQAGVFSEADDPYAHLGFDLSAADQESLSRAGTDTAYASLNGADSVGLGLGDYVREEDHFKYAGTSQGDFVVRFTWVGTGRGDYDYDNDLAGYRFVGTDSGQYVARRIVRLPEQSETYHATATAAPVPGMSVQLAGALSRTNRNRFAGNGYRLGLGYDGSAGYRQERFGFSCARRELGANLNLPGVAAGRDLAYTWNLDAVPMVYSRDEINGFAKPFAPVTLEASAGRLRASGLDRLRGGLGVKAWFADYRYERIGRLTRHLAGIAPTLGWFSPQVRANLDFDTLGRIREIVPGLTVKPRDDLSAGVSWRRTEWLARDSLSGAWPQQALLNIYRADARTTALRNLDVQALAGYERKSTRAADDNFDQFFASLTGSYSHPNGAQSRLALDRKYELTVPKQEIYVRVEQGKGEYSQDPETRRYYPDTLGEFVRRLVSATQTVPTVATTADFSGSVTSWSKLGLDLRGSFEQQVSDTARFVDAWKAGVDVRLLPYEQAFSAVLSDEISSRFDRLSTAEPETDREHKPALELRFNAADRLRATARLEATQIRRTTESGVLRNSEDAVRGLLQPIVGYGLELELKGGYSVRWIEMPDRGYARFRLNTLTLGAGRRFAFQQKTSIRADVTVEQRAADIARLPYEVTLTDPLGWTETFTLAADRMLGSVLVLSGNYTFQDRPDRAAEHNVSVSLKAFF